MEPFTLAMQAETSKIRRALKKLTQFCRMFIDKLVVAQLVKKLYGSERLIIVFTSVCPVLGQLNPVYVLKPHVSKINFNIVLPSML
jgi:hypothetical protein